MLGLYCNVKLSAHIKAHHDHKSFMECWCSTIWGDFLMLGTQLSALVWPLLVLGFIVYVALQFVRQIRGTTYSPIQFFPWSTNNQLIIVPNDAASALVNKALKHLVEGCEDHMAVCPYKEGSLSGLISFSKEILSRDMTSNGIMRMANLEERLFQAQDKYNELLKIISDPITLEQYLKKECFCGSKRQCQQHGIDKVSKL